MALTLWYHPLSSYCWKVLIALYEAEVAYTPRLVNLSDADDRAAFQQVWPLMKFPVLEDRASGEVVLESTIIVDWLAGRYAAARPLLPADPETALKVRLIDRLFDNYVHLPMQRVVAERLRPADVKDPFGAERSREEIRAGYNIIAPRIAGPWALGEAFTLADCSALPALHYADYAVSLAGWPHLRAYLERLRTRPAVARVLAEAEPYFQYFPLKDG
jgi:glutathione S-transferase